MDEETSERLREKEGRATTRVNNGGSHRSDNGEHGKENGLLYYRKGELYPLNKWKCSRCTHVNLPQTMNCEACDKRHLPGTVVVSAWLAIVLLMATVALSFVGAPNPMNHASARKFLNVDILAMENFGHVGLLMSFASMWWLGAFRLLWKPASLSCYWCSVL